MAPIDQPLAILAVRGIEMDLGGVLPQARGQHMLGLFDGDAIDMVDHLAHRIIAPAVRLARQLEIVAGEIQPRWHHQIRRRDRPRKLGDHRLGRGPAAPLAHHDPAHIAQNSLAPLVAPRGADPDNARFAVRVFLDPDHLG